MLPVVTPPTARQARFRELVLEMLRDGLSQTEIATQLGVSQGMVSAIVGQRKNAGERTIAEAIRRMKLHEDFFRARPPVSYHDFIPSAGSAFPEIEAYAAAMARAGTPIAPEHLVEMRRWRRAIGPVDPEHIEAWHYGLQAADARRRADEAREQLERLKPKR